MTTIENAPAGEKPSVDGTEKIPANDDYYILVSKIAAYLRTLAQTLTSKVFNLSDNTLTGTTAEFNTALSDGNFATQAGSETLTNKTLTSPVLTTPQINDTSSDHQYIFAPSELAADRTVTLPLLGSADEFTFNTHAQTLTNKTLTTPVINNATGIGQYINTIKASNETVNNSSTLQNDNDFSFAIAANEKWIVEMFLIVTSPSATSDFKFDFTVPASCTIYFGAGSNSTVLGWGIAANSASPVGLSTSTAVQVGSFNGTYGIPIVAIVVNSTNAGTVQFRWAQDTMTAENTVVLANSIMRRVRVA